MGRHRSSNTLNEIVGFTKLESSLVSKYLITLQELNYLERVILFGANPLKGKKSQYQITENFIAFWYRYIFPVKTEIERGNGDIYYALAVENLPFIAKSFGRWWGRDREGKVSEIDVDAESVTGKELILGECKWKNSLKVNKTLEVLQKRASYFDEYRSYKYLFTKTAVDIDEKQDVVNAPVSEYFNFY